LKDLGDIGMGLVASLRIISVPSFLKQRSPVANSFCWACISYGL